ncbi:M23 family metallopeptidase [Streptomyces spongiicola]|uniref:M23 family metallopeptidase n=1 Tax=Streptomyces spongiicola TaxID=1690221 RepID=UPI0033D0AAFB
MGHRQRDCHRRLFRPLPCALLVAFALLPAPAASANDGPAVSVQVAQLLEEVSKATATYERGLQASVAERARVDQLQWQLADRRREVRRTHDKLGAVARAQYRSGGNLAPTLELMFASDPEELLRGQRIYARATATVNRLLEEAREAEHLTSVAEEKAREAWYRLDARTAELARIKRGIETKLDAARWSLQAQADRSAASGRCPGSVPLPQTDFPEGSAWVTPVQRYTLSAGFDSAGTRWANRHTGQDFAVGIGSPVRSIGAGRVVSVSCGGGFGMQIVVQHNDGWYSQYAHLASVTVDQGDRVRTGQWLGQAGTTGNSTGPHLHFEVRLTPDFGSAVDPVSWLRNRGVWL